MKTGMKCSDLLPVKVEDASAETMQELLAQSTLGQNATYALVRSKVAAGEWEEVWKKNHKGTLVRAYRVAR